MDKKRIVLNSSSIEGALPEEFATDIFKIIGGDSVINDDIYYELRCAIKDYYIEQFDHKICIDRIFPTSNWKVALISITPVRSKILSTLPGMFLNDDCILNRYPVFAPVSSESSFKMDLNTIMKAWKNNIKMICVNNPSPLSGETYSSSELRSIAMLANARSNYLVVDESELSLSYEDHPISAVSLSDNIFVVNDFSGITSHYGFSFSWIISPVEHLKEINKNIENSSTALSPVEIRMALAVMDESKNMISSLRNLLRARRNKLFSDISKVNIGNPLLCNAGIHMLIDCSALTAVPSDIARTLEKEKGVIVYDPQENMCGGRFLRVSFGANEKTLTDGIEMISDYFSNHN